MLIKMLDELRQLEYFMELCSGAEVTKNQRYDFERFQMAKIENSLIILGGNAETFSFLAEWFD